MYVKKSCVIQHLIDRFDLLCYSSMQQQSEPNDKDLQ